MCFTVKFISLKNDDEKENRSRKNPTLLSSIFLNIKTCFLKKKWSKHWSRSKLVIFNFAVSVVGLLIGFPECHNI